VASNGLIERVRTNSITYSNDFTNGAWIKSGCTITANYGTAPDGTQTASRAVFSGTNKTIYQNISGSDSVGSLYIKGTAGQKIQFAVGTSEVLFTLTGSWQRLEVYNSGSFTYAIALNTFGASDAFDVMIWAAQLETGDVATAYIATTSAAVSVGPVSGLPRLDYLGSTCPKLQLEPSRTNLSTYSEQFDNAVWSKETGNSVTANTIASPDGYVNADTISATAGNAININQSHTSASNSAHTFSTFLKKNNVSEVQIYIFSSGFVSRATVNLDNGTITNVDGSGATITNYGNGWYRCSIQGVVNSGVGFTIGYLTASTTGARSVYAYGSQLEVGAYATSYIPTLGTSVTRVADEASKTGISSLIGSTAGTLYSEFVVNGFSDFGTPLCINNGSTTESIWLTTFGNGDIRAEVYSVANGGIQATFTKTGNVVGQTYKIAIAYEAHNCAFFVNGVQVGTTDTSCAMPVGMTRVDFDYTNSSLFVKSALAIKQALLFKTRLTNAQLAELTTL
jgi:hypothetical protein